MFAKILSPIKTRTREFLDQEFIPVKTVGEGLTWLGLYTIGTIVGNLIYKIFIS